MHDRDALETTATPHRVATLGEAGVLGEAARGRAYELLSMTPPAGVWLQLLSRLLLALGAALAVAGVVFFFAFNWASLPGWGKLSLLGASVALTALAALRQARSRQARQVLLLAASLLVGPLLGVYGQTYQTGADPWGLFALWGALALPWALVGQSPALWMVEVALADAATMLWFEQVQDGSERLAWGALAAAGVNAAAWLGWELLAARGASWARGRWWPRVAASSVLCALLPLAVVAIIDDLKTPALAAGLAAELLVIAGSLAAFRRRDLFVVAAALAAGMVVVDALVARVLFDGFRNAPAATLFMGMLVAAEVALAVHVLRRLGVSQESE